MIVLLLKITAMLAFGTSVIACMRQASAASRHLVLTTTLASVLLVPVASMALPELELRVLPVDAVSAAGQLSAASALPTGVSPDETTSSATDLAVRDASTVRDLALPWPLLLVGSGFAMLFVRSLINIRARRVIWSRAMPCPESRLKWAADRVRLAVGLDRPVSTRLSRPHTMPATFGALAPKLLLPRDANEWSDERLDAVLTHELTHVRRFDAVSDAIAQTASAIYWYHPLVWWLARQARLERERACDDAVIRMGMRPSRYAEHLLALRHALPIGAATALPMAQGPHMAQRLRAILDPRQTHEPRSRLSAVVALALVAGSVVVGAGVVTARVIGDPIAAIAAAAVVPEKVTVAASWASLPHPEAPPFVGVNKDGTPESVPNSAEAYVRFIENASGVPVGADALPPAELAGLWIGDAERNRAAINAGAAGPLDAGTMQVTLTDTAVIVTQPDLGRTITYPLGGRESTEIWRGQSLRHRASLRRGTLRVETFGGPIDSYAYWNVSGSELELETVTVSHTPNHQEESTRRSLFFTRAKTGGLQSRPAPQAIPDGNFGAGAYRPGNGVTDPVRLKEVKPVYTPAAKAAGLQGTVELEAVIGIDGAVKDVRVTRSLDATLGLDANAMDAVRQTPFTPCKRGDVPVPCLVVFELHYTLDNDANGQTPFGVGAYTQAEQPQLALPVRVRTIQPSYTPEAMRAKIEGSVTVECVVGSNGVVTEARVIRSLDRELGLDQKALEAVRATPFTPGRLNGVSVPVRIIMEVNFTLR